MTLVLTVHEVEVVTQTTPKASLLTLNEWRSHGKQKAGLSLDLTSWNYDSSVIRTNVKWPLNHSTDAILPDFFS